MTGRAHITEALRRDAPLLAELHALCFPADPWNCEAMDGLLSTPGLRGLIASRAQPEAMALVRFAADEAEILTIGVVPSARNGGMGGQILDAVIHMVKRRGTSVLFLEVAVDNAHARRLYTRRKFLEVGTRPAYYHRGAGPRQDALILKLAIGEALGQDGRANATQR